MEKERIMLFDEERKRLTDGRERQGTARKIQRGGVAFLSTISLGIALFAVVFIVCCFFGAFGVPAGAWRDGLDTNAPAQTTEGVTSIPPETQKPVDTDAPYDTDAQGKPATPDEKSFWEFLKSLFGIGKNTETTAVSDTTLSPPETDSPPYYESVDALYKFDYSAVPPGEIPIVPMDMSLLSYGENYIYNDTKYAPKIAALLESTDSIPAFNYTGTAVYPVGDPVVLIIHTHGTEAYSEEGAVSYKEGSGDLARSTDITKNVVAVGAVIAEVLNKNGVRTLHCQIMHDEESYKDSYTRAASTIAEYLARYPSIKYVIDVHRDSLTTPSGSLVRPVMLVDNKPVAQVMCVVGSDYNGADYKNWQNNLSLALKLRRLLNERYTNIARPVYLRSSAYNQQYAPMSLLLEIGASGNTLSEAKEAARLTAEALADIIKRKAG